MCTHCICQVTKCFCFRRFPYCFACVIACSLIIKCVSYVREMLTQTCYFSESVCNIEVLSNVLILPSAYTKATGFERSSWHSMPTVAKSTGRDDRLQML